MSVTEFYDELQKSRDFFSLVLGDGADIVISRTGAATGQNENVSAGQKPEHCLSQRRIFIHLNFFQAGDYAASAEFSRSQFQRC